MKHTFVILNTIAECSNKVSQPTQCIQNLSQDRQNPLVDVVALRTSAENIKIGTINFTDFGGVCCSKMALIVIGRLQLDLGQSKQLFYQSQTSLQLLNLDKGSNLQDEQFLYDLPFNQATLDHIQNSISSFSFTTQIVSVPSGFYNTAIGFLSSKISFSSGSC